MPIVTPFNREIINSDVDLYMEGLIDEEPVVKTKNKTLGKNIQQEKRKNNHYYNGYQMKSYVGDGGSDYYAWKKRAVVHEGEYVKYNGQIILA
jgi:hypothetical protein